MEDLLHRAKVILRGIWLNRWLGVIVAWLVGIAAAAGVFVTPDQYRASARIFVNTDSVLRPLLSGIVIQGNTEQQVAMLSRTLISRPNIEKVVRMADLDLRLKSSADKEALIERLLKTLKIREVGRDNLYTLEYQDRDPETARNVVQSLTTIFVESSLGGKQTDTDTAKKFVEEQIRIYQTKLEEAETKLKEFKLKNLGVPLDAAGGSSGRIAETTTQLNQARLELREAENARSVLRQQVAGATSVGTGTSTAIVIPEIENRLDTLRRKLDSLLQQYTEQHPDVRSARRLIDELEVQKKIETEARRKAAAANPTLANDAVSPALREALVRVEAQVASLSARVAEYQSRYSAAVAQMKMIPQIEAEYAQLNRDYDTNKKNYDTLVQRRESASISEGMSSVSGVADFRLIDPPRASREPVAPDRRMLMPLALLASLAAGVGAAFAVSQLRPAFFDSNTLREFSGLPLLGVVSMWETPESLGRDRKDRYRLATAVGSLAGLYGVGVLVIVMMRGA